MYLPGTPKKDGLYWLCPNGKKVEESIICHYHGESNTWYDICTGSTNSPVKGDLYWDLQLLPPKDYAMGGSYSCYMRDKDQRLEEISDDDRA